MFMHVPCAVKSSLKRSNTKPDEFGSFFANADYLKFSKILQASELKFESTWHKQYCRQQLFTHAWQQCLDNETAVLHLY